MIFYLFLTSSKDICKNSSESEPNDLSTFFNSGGNNDIFFFQPHSKIFAEVSSETEPNNLLNFFNSGGNNDILSFFNLIQRYLRKFHRKVNQMICQLFSTLVGTNDL